MELINKSRDFDKKTLYLLTQAPDADKMQLHKGEVMTITDFVVFETVNKKTGEVMEVLAVMDNQGEVHKTISKTFAEDFLNMWEIFIDELNTELPIRVIGGKSNNGREFITCTYAG